MIKLKQLILEINAYEKQYSWQDVYGKFIPVKKSHDEDALEILMINSDDPISDMWSRGYMRVVFTGKEIIAHNEINSPNEKQKRELINLAKDSNAISVEYDKGRPVTKTIWSKHDVLEKCVVEKIEL